MAIIKAVMYVLAVLLLVGGGLCAATAVFVPMQGMGEIAAIALVVMLISFVVMKLVGKPKFSAGSPGEAVLYILLFLFFGMPTVQGLAFGLGHSLGLGAFAPLLSLAAFAGVVYFFVRRYKRLSAARQSSESTPTDQPPHV